MAAPVTKTNKDLNGKWVMSKSLSDSAEPGLVIQGIGFLVRKGIGLATVTLTVTQHEGPPKPPNTSTDNVVHIDITQSASGLSTSNESRCLDNEFRERNDSIFGKVKGQSSWVGLDEIESDFLKKGWEFVEGEDEGGKHLVRSYVVSLDNGWTATQIWGFQTVNGERRYCRNVLIEKDGKSAEFRLVYDYAGDA